VGNAGPRGDVPVDGADVVTGLILANLGELHPAALECSVVAANDSGFEDEAGVQPDPSDLAQRLAIECRHLLFSWGAASA
jgi:hypothetical protein